MVFLLFFLQKQELLFKFHLDILLKILYFCPLLLYIYFYQLKYHICFVYIYVVFYCNWLFLTSYSWMVFIILQLCPSLSYLSSQPIWAIFIMYLLTNLCTFLLLIELLCLVSAYFMYIWTCHFFVLSFILCYILEVLLLTWCLWNCFIIVKFL